MSDPHGDEVYHVGLDFGTSQTKVCVQHVTGRPRVHEFLEFDGPDGPSFFLPSRISVDGGRVQIGHAAPADRSFRYFKIASAEDVEFRAGAGGGTDPLYDPSSFSPYTPESLSVLYLARVLLSVQAQIEERRQRPSAAEGPSGRGLRKRRAAPVGAARVTVQLGIPTEYSSPANVLRKRKFETILLLAAQVAEQVGSASAFDSMPIEGLTGLVRGLSGALAGDDHGIRRDEELEERGLSVFPESAAGLAALTQSGRLRPGYYAAIDIGGGSTDLSFFRVNDDETTSYLASESLLTASNDVYRAYAGSADIGQIAQAERAVRALVEGRPQTALADPRYTSAISATTARIHRAAYRMFNGRVYWFFPRGAQASWALRKYASQPCFVYGGGSALPVDRWHSEVTIHDNGVSTSRDPENYTKLRRDPLSDHLFETHTAIRPDLDRVRTEGHVLAVAFGLSFLNRPGETPWDDHDYRNSHAVGKVPHPVNAGMYVYDVIARGWFK